MKPKHVDNLRNQLSAKAQQLASTETRTMLSEMALQELGRAKNHGVKNISPLRNIHVINRLKVVL